MKFPKREISDFKLQRYYLQRQGVISEENFFNETPYHNESAERLTASLIKP